MNNSKIQIQKINKKLFSKTPFKATFRLNFETNQTRDLLIDLLKEISEANPAINLRGRPKETFNSSAHSNHEELIFIYGNQGLESEFNYSLSTVFSKYTSNNKVEHNVVKHAGGIISRYESYMNLEKVFTWLPLKIEGFRLGIENYSNYFFGSMIGAMPSIEKRFYIESDRNGAWILVENNGPIYSHPLLIRLDNFLNQSNILNSLIANLKKVV